MGSILSKPWDLEWVQGKGVTPNTLQAINDNFDVIFRDLSGLGVVTRGDLAVGDENDQWNVLPIGAAGTALSSDGTDPSWSSTAVPTVGPGGSLLASDGDVPLWVVDIEVNTVVISSASATALDVVGGARFGSGIVALIGTDGRLNGPLSSTIIDDLSGANLTGLVEANITDGAILARVAGNETISGTWTFNNALAWGGGAALASSTDVLTDG